MATVNDAPKTLDLRYFYSISSGHESFLKSNRFAVRINPVGSLIAGTTTITQDLLYLCEVADMPGRSFDQIGIRYYGPQEFFPLMSNYTDSSATFTFLCRNKGIEREFFDNWMMLINPPNTFDFNYRDDYRAEIDLYQFSEVGEEHTANYKLTLMDAWPSQIAAQPMTWADDVFQRIVVTFTYVKWIRKGIDPAPRDTSGGYSFALVNDRPITR